MEIIAHRRNTIEDLKATPIEYGVEVDIRSNAERLIIHHDPFVDAVAFDEWIEYYKHKTLILNVKEEGLEQACLRHMEAKGIADFFFLDQSFPFLMKTSANGERRCAARVSEYESIETPIALSGRIDWIWVDCFTKFPLTSADGKRLKDAGFKLCLVSPELQGRHSKDELRAYRDIIKDPNLAMDAVCTKYPEFWEV